MTSDLETNIVSVERVQEYTEISPSNPVHGEVYSMQDYVIKFVSN
jgi:hypothetical protein